MTAMIIMMTMTTTFQNIHPQPLPFAKNVTHGDHLDVIIVRHADDVYSKWIIIVPGSTIALDTTMCAPSYCLSPTSCWDVGTEHACWPCHVSNCSNIKWHSMDGNFCTATGRAFWICPVSRRSSIKSVSVLYYQTYGSR